MPELTEIGNDGLEVIKYQTGALEIRRARRNAASVIVVTYRESDEFRNAIFNSNMPIEIMGVKWPLTVYVCASCARPTLWSQDKCCSGHQYAILVGPTGREVDQWLIEEIDLSVRAYNNLKRANINTVGDLVKHTASEIQAIPNMGKKAMDDLMESMERYGLMLKEEE